MNTLRTARALLLAALAALAFVSARVQERDAPPVAHATAACAAGAPRC